MSWIVSGMVQERVFASSHTKFVALMLSSWCGDDGTGLYASRWYTAMACQLNERTVQRIIQDLIQKELLDIDVEADAQAKLPRMYSFNMENLAALPLTKAAEATLERKRRQAGGARGRPHSGTGDSVSGKSDTAPPVQGKGGETGKAGTGDSVSGKSDTAPPTGSLVKPENKPDAREAGGGDPDGPPPACAVWKDHQGALQGLPTWPLLERAIPDHDDGAKLVLAVEAPAFGFAILAWAAPAAELILERRLLCRVRYWVQPALIDRKIQQGVPDSRRHRRDGELVSLDDPAWKIWLAYEEDTEKLSCAAVLAKCLPDDLTKDHFTILAADEETLTAIKQGAGKEWATLISMPGLAHPNWNIGVALDARKHSKAGTKARAGTDG